MGGSQLANLEQKLDQGLGDLVMHLSSEVDLKLILSLDILGRGTTAWPHLQGLRKTKAHALPSTSALKQDTAVTGTFAREFPSVTAIT